MRFRREFAAGGDRCPLGGIGQALEPHRQDRCEALTLPSPLHYVVGVYREPMIIGASVKVRWND
jgi:hypothetical protein